MLDPVALAVDLVRCPSVTPGEGGALDLLQGVLEERGFACRRLVFSEEGTPDVDNLYARLGDSAPNFCFAGHTDVVPPGPAEDWSSDPFAGEIRDSMLFGRGAADMKGAIAAFVAAVDGLLESGPPPGSVSLLITGDEEGPAVNGTAKMLGWLEENGEALDLCVVGEPTNPSILGEMAKIGRRGSLNAVLTVSGVQGHVAYPDRADNAAHRLLGMLSALTAEPLDGGSAHFPPSSLQVTSIDVANPTENLIPGTAEARFNIRFNDRHDSRSLTEWLRCTLDGAAGEGGRYDLAVRVSGESFVFPPGALSELICDSVEAVCGRRPELSTSGGTSDARFIKDHCPVAEFGLVGATMHKVDECARIDDIRALSAVYRTMLEKYFGRE